MRCVWKGRAGVRRAALAPSRPFSLPAARELLAAVLLLMIPALAGSQSAPQDGDTTRLSVSGLRPGDFIQVDIWREPDLSDTVQVDQAGLAVFPKLGRILVTGISPDSLERLLVSGYSQYLQNPAIRVKVMRRITVLGAVLRPGTYPVDLTMTITEALALAGGPSPDGKSDEVQLRRGTTRRTVDLSAENERLDDLALHSGDQLFVPRRSWVSRNPGVVMGMIGTLTSIVWLIAR